jgi:starch synthase (maltosyl-transferring)
MKFVINDHWKAIFIPAELGYHQFRIEAWVDHYQTWSKGVQKKAAAGQDLVVEFEIGARLLELAAESASAEKEKLMA